MNYMLPDPTKETSCKNCIFAIFDGNKQSGCLDNRIEKYGDDVIEAYDHNKEFYVIKRKCSLHRKSNWNQGVKDIEKAKLESAITFDIFIDCSNITESEASMIINEVQNIHYPRDKMKMYLFQEFTDSKEQRQRIMNISNTIKYNTVSAYFNKVEYIYSIFHKSKNLFHIFLDKNNIQNIGLFLNKANNIIEEELKKYLICKNLNKTLISNIVLKMLYPALYVDYESQIIELEQKCKDENLFVEF